MDFPSVAMVCRAMNKHGIAVPANHPMNVRVKRKLVRRLREVIDDATEEDYHDVAAHVGDGIPDEILLDEVLELQKAFHQKKKGQCTTAAIAVAVMGVKESTVDEELRSDLLQSFLASDRRFGQLDYLRLIRLIRLGRWQDSLEGPLEGSLKGSLEGSSEGSLKGSLEGPLERKCIEKICVHLDEDERFAVHILPYAFNVLLLGYMGVYKDNLLQKFFTCDKLTTHKKGKTGMKEKLRFDFQNNRSLSLNALVRFVDGMIEVDHPEYKGPKLDFEVEETRTSAFFIPLPMRSIKHHGYARYIWEEIGRCLYESILTELVGDAFAGDAFVPEDFVLETSILPHLGLTDFVFVLDSNGRAVPIPEAFKQIPLGQIKFIPDGLRNDLRWFTVNYVDTQKQTMFLPKFRDDIYRRQAEKLGFVHFEVDAKTIEKEDVEKKTKDIVAAAIGLAKKCIA